MLKFTFHFVPLNKQKRRPFRLTGNSPFGEGMAESLRSDVVRQSQRSPINNFAGNESLWST